MNKKTLLVLMAGALITAQASAQKATGAKQDEILKKEAAIAAKMDSLDAVLREINITQQLMFSLYGSEMNMLNEPTAFSYAYGLSLGENFKTQGIGDVDFIAFNRGMLDALANSGDAKMSPENAQRYLNEYFNQRMAEQAKKAKEEGEKWLAANAKKPGVTVTESGLQYEVVTQGTGEKPTATSEVTVHYHGTTTDGQVFDSSVQRGKPATFPLNQVIKGWTEGLQLMTVGSKYRFYIPSELAYGERGAGGAIGPNQVLIFDVELISIAAPK